MTWPPVVGTQDRAGAVNGDRYKRGAGMRCADERAHVKGQQPRHALERAFRENHQQTAICERRLGLFQSFKLAIGIETLNKQAAEASQRTCD